MGGGVGVLKGFFGNIDCLSEISRFRFLKTSIIYIPLISEGLKQFDTSLLYFTLLYFTLSGSRKVVNCIFYHIKYSIRIAHEVQ